MKPITAEIADLKLDVRELNGKIDLDVRELNGKIDKIHTTLDNHMNENFKELRSNQHEILLLLVKQNNP